jgi:hypothetical protein
LTLSRACTAAGMARTITPTVVCSPARPVYRHLICNSLTPVKVGMLTEDLTWLYATDDAQVVQPLWSGNQILDPVKNTSNATKTGSGDLPTLSSLAQYSPTVQLPCVPFATAADFLSITPCGGSMNPTNHQGLYFPQTGITLPAPDTSSLKSSPTPSQSAARSVAKNCSPTAEMQDHLVRDHKEPVSGRQKPSNKHQKQVLATRAARVPHSIIERRYRHNLKSHLDILTTKLPTFKKSCDSMLDIEDSNRRIKDPSKADVIAAAVKHIEELQSENARRKEFTSALQEQIQGLQKLVRCDDCSILRYLQAVQVVSSIAEVVPDVHRC